MGLHSLLHLLCALLLAGASDVQRVLQATQTLQDSYYHVLSNWDAGGWWNKGNSLEAVCNSIQYAKDTRYHGVLGEVWAMTALEFPIHLETTGNDDKLWWALAWVRAYEATGEKKYLSRSKAYFRKLTGYWDSQCGGGVWWNLKRTYKNAITNELFFVLAGKLYRIEGNGEYLEWAKREWAWFEQSGMLRPNGLIVDGLTSSCTPTGITYTYNQGVILGGLAELSLATGNTTLLRVAEAVVNGTMRSLTRSGILAEPVPSSPDHDQFKGIFARYVGYLLPHLPDSTAATFRGFLSLNADSLWNVARNATTGIIGFDWSAPPSITNARTHTSGLDCLTALLG